MFSIFSWEESKNMNYELDYNGRINLARTLLKEYFDGLLSFPQFKVVFCDSSWRIFSFYGMERIFLEISQNISFKSNCMKIFPLLCRTASSRRLFYKEMEMR